MDVLPLPREGSPEAEVEVVVAGAGPVGLFLGCMLQRAGVKVVVVDPHIEQGQQSKAAVTMPRSFEVMDLVGAGAKASAIGRRLTGARLALGHEWVGELTGFRAEGMHTRYHPIATGQLNIERALLERYKELGGRLLRATRFVGYTEAAGGGVEVQVERSVYVRPPAVAPELPAHLLEPARTTFRARYLVGCDGKQSAVRGAMGAGFVGKEYPQSFFLADATIDEAEARRVGMDTREMYVVQELSSASLVLMVHMHDEQWRVYYCAKGLERSLFTEDFIPERARQMFPAPGPPKMALRDLSFYKVDCRLVDTYQKGPCLLAGDAAHCHSPAGGQGMNTGLQDAANLGWKLAAVLRRGAPESLLRTYGQERRPCAEWVLATSDKIFAAMTDQRSPLQNAVRRMALTALTTLVSPAALPPRFLRERIFGISISYAADGTCRDLGDALPARALAAGQRLPDLPCAVAGSQERFALQLLEDAPCFPFLLLFVACHPPKAEELRHALKAFAAHADAGVTLRPCVYVAPPPCCLNGCLPLPHSAEPVAAAAGLAEDKATAPELCAAGLWPPMRLTPAPGRAYPSLVAALRLPVRGRALLVVRPDGHVAVAQRGSWSGKAVVEAMEDLAFWPRV